MNRSPMNTAPVDRYAANVRPAVRPVNPPPEPEPEQEAPPENPKHVMFRQARIKAVRAILQYADEIGAPDAATEWVIDDVGAILTAIAQTAVRQTAASD